LLVYEIAARFRLSQARLAANPRYPAEPKTAGERLRKWRMDRGMIAKEVAKELGVCEETVLNWERGISERGFEGESRANSAALRRLNLGLPADLSVDVAFRTC